MTVFTRTEFTLDDIGNSHSFSIEYKINGFWSTSSLSIYVRIDTDWKTNARKVTYNVSRSSGGRDTEEEPNEIAATRNYAAALMDAASVCEMLAINEDYIIQVYNRKQAEREAEREADKAKAQAKVDADKHIKSYEAVWIADDMKAEAGRDNQSTRKFRMRGQDKTVTIHCMNYGKTRFYIGQQATSRKEAVKLIANMAEEV